ncbi:MAG: DUF4838 domain-containing protein [Puniceicoccales bacterium]|nr:DUF4838 domain-containing protein [Puniceicoccales bacterium]
MPQARCIINKECAGVVSILFTLVVFLAAVASPPSLYAQPTEFSGHAGRRWLVHNGKFNGHIFIGKNASHEERESAQLLSHWIETVTGTVANIQEEKPGTRLLPGVYIGTTQAAIDRDITAPSRWGDSWRWEPKNGYALFIRGNSDTATRMATADFIQHYLGVSFLLPGEWGAEWVPLKMVRLPERAYTQKPAYAWRSFASFTKPEERQWALNNGLGNFPPFSHALYSVFDEKAWAAHPEFFSIVGGVVKKPSGRGGHEPQPNLAVPGAAAYAAGRASAYFQAHPDATTFPLGINDNMTWDESTASVELTPRNKYFRGKPDYSNYVFAFMNRVATTLWTHPGGTDWDAMRWNDGVTDTSAPSPEKLLGCLAYYHCENLPTFPVHPNVFPVVTADRSQWRDPAFKAEDEDLIRRWSESGARHFGIYEYYYGTDYLIPRVFLESEIDSIRTGAKYGASLFFGELAPNWGFDGPKAWLAAKLLQTPGLSASLLLRDYYSKAYGAAAGPMREFYDKAEQCWNDQPGPARWIKFWRMENMGELISLQDQQQLRAALDAAESAFPFAPYPGSIRNEDALFRQQARVRMTSCAFAVTERFLEWYRLRRDILRITPATPEEAHTMLDLLQQEITARNIFLDTLKSWRSIALNPGGAPPWNAYFTGDIDATACIRILQHYDPANTAWQEVYHKLTIWAGNAGLQPLLHSAATTAPPVTLAKDGFDTTSFRKPKAGSWASGRNITVLRNPWQTVLFENQSIQFGNSAEAPRTGSGSLCISGSEQTTLTRYAKVAPGGWILAQAFCRGRINPGTYTGFELRFYDANGRVIGSGKVAILHPADYADWTPLAGFARVPDKAVTVGVAIRSMSQEADEALFFDDFSIEQISADATTSQVNSVSSQ